MCGLAHEKEEMLQAFLNKEGKELLRVLLDGHNAENEEDMEVEEQITKPKLRWKRKAAQVEVEENDSSKGSNDLTISPAALRSSPSEDHSTKISMLTDDGCQNSGGSATSICEAPNKAGAVVAECTQIGFLPNIN
ncbi:hypothetical protein A0H81_09648 [Grifola frondosa]|uniref:Uncharacterized protein n=1 Tax=Grifola frondosa TaxID=5627 RepID=A0A1C7M4J3_GRIFR|nr:hypothetical protein A0H81_09648 [Grifola frondosa]